MVDLLPGENIIVGMRKSWFVFFMQSFSLILAAVVPIVLFPFYKIIFSQGVDSLGPERFQNVVVFFVGGWLLLLTIVFFVLITNYYLNIVIVTNERLMDITQDSLFARDIVICPLEKIEDVKVEIFGIFATFFKFGNLYIQTGGEKREMLVHGIRYPEYARDTIMKAYENVRLNKPKA